MVTQENIKAQFVKYLVDYCENVRVRPGEKGFAGGYAVKAPKNIDGDYVLEETVAALHAAHAAWGSQAPANLDIPLKEGGNYVMALVASEAFAPCVIVEASPPSQD